MFIGLVSQDYCTPKRLIISWFQLDGLREDSFLERRVKPFWVVLKKSAATISMG
jgi:hypothetical protein